LRADWRVSRQQKKSVEQVAVENLRLLFDQWGSPEAVLRSVRGLPHPSVAAVDDMEAAIVPASVPVGDKGTFGESQAGEAR
jgi:hypothetical protein